MSIAGKEALCIGLLILGLPSCSPVQADGLALDSVEFITNLVRPVGVVDPGDDTNRLFIVQQHGEIRIWNGASLEAAPFLDLSSAVISGGEKGLLGLAFHPDYPESGEFFVNYNRTRSGQLETVVSRFTVSDDYPDLADPGSEDILLVINQPADNHNAGDLAFGPDGYLYVPSGDGGGSGDPNENAQDLGTLLGKILRIDVDSAPDPGLAYAIPPDNPFIGQAGARDEIWAYGLRNPFRFSFDRETGDLWIGDVGQNAWEEVDLQPAQSDGGENYGWDCREGAHDYTGPDNDNLLGCAGRHFTDPILEYAHTSQRCSLTGGFRYRGDAFPRLRSVYVFADFCSGEVFGSVPSCNGSRDFQTLLNGPAFSITTFGQDAAGELYFSERVDTDNPVSKIHRLALDEASGGPDLLLSPATLDFGSVEAGDTVTLVLTLENVNSGPEAAMVRNQTLSDPSRFTLDVTEGAAPCRSGGLQCRSPGESCTLAISLKADLSGVISETLSFEGNFENEIIDLNATVLPCSSDVDLAVTNLAVAAGESKSRRACDTITAGPNVTVNSGGTLALQAGTRVVLGSGVQVRKGAKLAVEIF